MWTRLYPILFDVGPTQLVVGVTWQLRHFTISYLHPTGSETVLPVRSYITPAKRWVPDVSRCGSARRRVTGLAEIRR
jgi:hypothetical protein